LAINIDSINEEVIRTANTVWVNPYGISISFDIILFFTELSSGATLNLMSQHFDEATLVCFITA
jgi:hypothetical protein